MNQKDRLRENRRDYRNKFFLGFFGGSGLFSVLALALYNFLVGKQSKDRQRMDTKEDRGPEQFETIYNSSEKE